jgi:hypothetical protein
MDFKDRLEKEIQIAQQGGAGASELWALFKSATPEQRVIVFHHALEAGVLDDEYTFEMLTTIRGDCDLTTPEDRAHYADLLDRLRQHDPKLFQESSSYCHRDLINFAIIEGRWDDLSELLTPFTSGNDLDTFITLIAQLKYHGQVRPLVEAMKTAWPKIKDSPLYVEWASEEFAGILMELMLVNYLESSSDPRPDDPQLIESTAFLLPWEQGWLDWFIPSVTQPEPSEWRSADFSAAEDPETRMHKIATMQLAFIATQWRVGVPLSRGLMAWHKWLEIIQVQSKAFKKTPKRKKTGPPRLSHLLIPQSNHMDKVLGESFSILGGEPYEVVATLELIPAYLDFLETLGLIQSIERQQALKKIRPLVDQMPQIIKYYEGDPVAIETLLAAWANL